MRNILFKSLVTAALATLLGLAFPSEVGMAWITTAIGVGAGVLSSLYGGAAAADEARKAQRLLARKEAEEKAWYDRRYNQRYLDTEAGQNLIRKATEIQRRNNQRAEGAARVAGATTSAVAKAKEQGNKVMGDTIANIAANDTARRDNVDLQHRSMMNNITNQRIGVHNQQAANITNAASQASNSLIKAGTYLEKDDDFWTGLTKGGKKSSEEKES